MVEARIAVVGMDALKRGYVRVVEYSRCRSSSACVLAFLHLRRPALLLFISAISNTLYHRLRSSSSTHQRGRRHVQRLCTTRTSSFSYWSRAPTHPAIVGLDRSTVHFGATPGEVPRTGRLCLVHRNLCKA
jgi:hypothetical protein